MLGMTSCQKFEIPEEKNTHEKTDGGKGGNDNTDDNKGNSNSSNSSNSGSTTVETNEHVAVLSDNELGEGKVLYMSLMEWTLPTLSKGGKEEAERIAAEYREGDMTDWHIPTYDEASLMKGQYDVVGDNADAITALNERLETAGGCAFYNKQPNGDSKRYVCDGCNYTYNFLGSRKKPIEAGQMTKYYLRLVKTVTVTE